MAIRAQTLFFNNKGQEVQEGDPSIVSTRPNFEMVNVGGKRTAQIPADLFDIAQQQIQSGTDPNVAFNGLIDAIAQRSGTRESPGGIKDSQLFNSLSALSAGKENVINALKKITNASTPVAAGSLDPNSPNFNRTSSGTPTVDPSLPSGLIKFETPSGGVFGVNENGTIRAATGQEAVDAATGKAKFSTVKATTNQPFTEFVGTSAGGTSGGSQGGTPTVDPSLPSGLIKFETPSGGVFGVNENGTIRAATGQEAVDAATGKAKFSTVKATTNQPFTEFVRSPVSISTGGEGAAGATGTDTGIDTEAAARADKVFNDYLSSSNLPEDQKAMLRAIYDATGTNDVETVNRLTSAMQAAKEFSNPFFKAQISLVLDGLKRGIASGDANLAEQETSLQNALRDLRADITSGKDFLTFQQNQELKALDRRFSQELETTRNNLAATGFTQSSRRSKTEGLLEETFGDIRESANRAFTERITGLESQKTRNERNTALEIERLRRLTKEGKIDALRQAEQQVGSEALAAAGQPVFGGVGGSIPRQQLSDQLSFAQSFVF